MENSKVILSVDDEKIVLNSLRSMFSRHFGKEYDLEFAESAAEAFEIIEEIEEEGKSLFAIVSDWLMPEMKGDEFLKQATENRPHVRTIILSGQADDDAIRDAMAKTHLDFFISKPWDEADLLAKITS